MRARVTESASRNGVNTVRKKSRCRCESAAVMAGPSVFHTSEDARVMTHARFTRPGYSGNPAGGGRSRQPGADDVAQVLEILHHFGTVERFVDQDAGARRVDDKILPGCGADGNHGKHRGRRQDVKTHDQSSVMTPGPRSVNRRRAGREWEA